MIKNCSRYCAFSKRMQVILKRFVPFALRLISGLNSFRQQFYYQFIAKDIFPSFSLERIAYIRVYVCYQLGLPGIKSKKVGNIA